MGAWRRGLCERTWQQTGHGQDAGLVRRRLGVLPEHVADLLPHALAQGHLEGRISLSEGFSQVAEIVRLTELIATLRQNRGDSRYQALLLVAEHGQNRPLQVLEGFQKGFERGLVLLSQPATA